MWILDKPSPVKLIVGILAADENALTAARGKIALEFGRADSISEIFPFDKTEYYKEQTGADILRQFVTIEELIEPGRLAQIKHKTNEIEQELAEVLEGAYPRPVNLDPGYMEPSKLVLASTKNFAHRIYIGDNMYAEITLRFDKGKWVDYPHTFPDFKDARYHGFLNKVREKLVRQLRQLKQTDKENND
jgi:hypothetical protein